MKRRICFFLCVLLLPLAGGPVAVFEKPVPGARFMIVDASRLTHSGKTLRKFVPFHPLARMYTFSEVKAGTVTGYLRRGVVVKSDGRRLAYSAPTPAEHVAAGIVLACALEYALSVCQKKR